MAIGICISIWLVGADWDQSPGWRALTGTNRVLVLVARVADAPATEASLTPQTQQLHEVWSPDDKGSSKTVVQPPITWLSLE